MTDDFLRQKLRRVARRYWWIALMRKLAVCWAAAALAGSVLVWSQRELGWGSRLALPLLVGVAGAVATAMVLLHFMQRTDYRWIARKIEAKHPELNGLLLTVVQQSFEPGRQPDYFQSRLIQEANARSQEHDWRQVVPGWRLAAMQGVHLAALACFLVALAGLRITPVLGEAPGWVSTDGVAVTPGDASIERGESLVVLARFDQTLPPSVNLVVRESGAPERSIPLVKSLADPVFGGSVTEVAKDFTYHLEYRGQRTRDFKVTVFEHPKLVRSDVELTFPDYTKLTRKRIEDTRRVSAVEGTKLDFALQLNKPVKSAKLIARDGKKTEVPLAVEQGKPVATLSVALGGAGPLNPPESNHALPAIEKTTTYDLQLIDAEGRANKVASPFVIDVQPNRPPEIRLASPRGDVRPSPLEEITFDGTVWDDFGTPAYGFAYSVAGGESKTIELGREAAAKEKRSFAHLLKLEELGVKPDDLISWYVWAEDIGPDGKPRRTNGDLFFAEVRAFDEIFRESQNMESAEQQQQQGGQGGQMRQLTELQKQIINATWRLQREGPTPKYAEDVRVVSDSQEQVLEQAESAMAEARSPAQQALWKEAAQHMQTAVDRLKDAAKEPEPLAQALPPEQAAYQSLLKLQARETAVTRSQRRGGGGGGQQANQRQIDQLDLKQSENRYETQRQARAPQNQERREQLAVMNRLQELARRQQDLNERMKELQTALQEARTEQEREEIRRRLKRLEEEQRQMLADVDEVRQRMERPENQSRMAEERQQLEQTREDVQRAADAAAEGTVAQALASGTRAQRQLQEMRDEMRKENSSQFSEQMRDMRNEARELSREQDQLTERMESLANQRTQRRSLSDSGESKEVLDQLTEQQERMNRLVDQATQVSEQAENTEPLLSRQLYDSVRRLSQDDANSVKEAREDLLATGALTFDLRDRLQKAADRDGSAKALEVTSEMLREGAVSQASRASQRAREEIDQLRRGVERAAESVLGDDAEQLRLAQTELDALTDQLEREIARAEGSSGARAPSSADQEQEAAEGGRGTRRDSGLNRFDEQSGDQSQVANADGQQPGAQQGGEPQEGQQPGSGQREGRERRVAQNSQSGEQQNENSPGARTPPSADQEQQAAEGGRGPGGEQTADANSPQPGQQQGGQGQGDVQPGGQPQEGQQRGRGQLAGGERGGRDQGGGRQRLTIDDILSGRTEGGGGGGPSGPSMGWEGPLTSEAFGGWENRLRDVEDLLEAPDLRNAVAEARERARMVRREFRQDLRKPDWTKVQLEIVKPLVEVRQRVAEELSRRESNDSLAPIDRDPVPNRYAESVRRYYEELGTASAEARP